jgi:diacylglycerol O-acyltransferase
VGPPRTSIERLTAEDQLMLVASARWPQDVCAVARFDGRDLFDDTGRFRIEAVRDAIQCRLHLVPRFRQLIHVPGRGLGAPLWVDAPAFDISQHVGVLSLAEFGGEAGLLVAAEHLRRRRLDPSRPLWEIWFITGLPGREVGMFVKIHHAIADGLAAMMMLGALLDHEPEAPRAPSDTRPEPPRPWRPARRPTFRRLFRDNVQRQADAIAGAYAALLRPRSTMRQVRQAWPAVRELIAERPAPKTSLDRVVRPGCRLAVIRTSHGTIRRIGRAHDSTVNDILLAATAGGLRALLVSRGERVESLTMRVYVPVTLRRRLRGGEQGTQIAQMVIPLPVGEPDPARRLAAIAAETTRRKARIRTSLGTLFRGRIVRQLMLLAVIRQRVNVTTASIPGPRRPLSLAGARMLEVFPVLALIGNVPLGVGALSYAGGLSIGIAADLDAFPDLDVFAMALRDELRALGAEAEAEFMAIAQGPDRHAGMAGEGGG